MIDFRVGEIKRFIQPAWSAGRTLAYALLGSCEKHPDSDKLLVEQIDVGEEAHSAGCLTEWQGRSRDVRKGSAADLFRNRQVRFPDASF